MIRKLSILFSSRLEEAEGLGLIKFIFQSSFHRDYQYRGSVPGSNNTFQSSFHRDVCRRGGVREGHNFAFNPLFIETKVVVLLYKDGAYFFQSSFHRDLGVNTHALRHAGAFNPLFIETMKNKTRKIEATITFNPLFIETDTSHTPTLRS